MSYSIETIPSFDKDVKKLKKRFPNIKSDIKELITKLQDEPTLGTHLSEGFYKIRLKNSSVPTGKSGGFRVITYFVQNETLYLVSMYSKSDTDTILIEKLKEIISK
jgi:mRNA-degrading endonuclease RelE of RelBE toxin-antitoxin system